MKQDTGFKDHELERLGAQMTVLLRRSGTERMLEVRRALSARGQQLALRGHWKNRGPALRRLMELIYEADRVLAERRTADDSDESFFGSGRTLKHA